MPGISFVCGRNLGEIPALESLDDLRHEPDYFVESLIQDANTLLLFSGYKGYPRQVARDEGLCIVVEGLIYNKSDAEIERQLRAISESDGDAATRINLIRKFVDDSDGEFLVLMQLAGSGETIIFNDRWARLPAYYYSDDDRFILARELKFALRFVPVIEFDRFSLAQFLTLQFILGDRTLLKGVHRIPPSCMLRVTSARSPQRCEITQLLPVDFEESSAPLSPREAIEQYKDLFLNALENRVRKVKDRGYRIAVAVSGGYDTRAVFGGMCQLDVDVDVEYFTNVQITGDETEYAAELTAHYGQNLNRFEASQEMDYSCLSHLVYATDCTVNGLTTLSCYRNALEQRNSTDHVPSVVFGGLGGEFIRRPYKALEGYRTVADMVKAGRFVPYMKIEEACSIVGLDVAAFLKQLSDYFSEYPETTLRDQVKHLYFEKYNSRCNSGQDRMRMHFWPVQALWSKDLVAFAFKSIPRSYIDGTFYEDFLRALDPNLLAVPFWPGSVRAAFPQASARTRQDGVPGGLPFRALARVWPIAALLMRFPVIRRLRSPLGKLLKTVRQRTPAPDAAAPPTAEDEHAELKAELLKRYARLEVLGPLLDERAICAVTQRRHRTPAILHVLLTVIVYFGEVEKRFMSQAEPPLSNTGDSQHRPC